MDAKQIPIAMIHESSVNPRRELTNIEELAASIEATGAIIQPLALRPSTGNEQDGYIVLAGHRRLAAAKHIGLTEVPAIILYPEKNNETSDDLKTHLIENIQRENLTPVEVARSIGELMRGRKIRARALAKALGKSDAWISKYHTIAKAIALQEKEYGPEAAEYLDEYTDTDKLYKEARRIMGLDDETKTVQEQTKKTNNEEGEGEGEKQDDLAEPEIPIREQLQELILAWLKRSAGPKENRYVEISPETEPRVTITLTFEALENALKAFSH